MYILASGSPRRKELMGLISKDFKCLVSDVSEDIPKGMNNEEVPAFLALKKARAVAQEHPNETVIGADTVVILGEEILGKPKDAPHAKAMLKSLSGNEHRVITGVAVIKDGKETTFTQISEVIFYPLSEELINWYVSTGEPMDKAGAYGIQEKGALLVKEIKGDYYNIMGFPVARLARLLGEIE